MRCGHRGSTENGCLFQTGHLGLRERKAKLLVGGGISGESLYNCDLQHLLQTHFHCRLQKARQDPHEDRDEEGIAQDYGFDSKGHPQQPVQEGPENGEDKFLKFASQDLPANPSRLVGHAPENEQSIEPIF